MNTGDIIGTAIGNTFRSRTRTVLTVLAIFVGAFTLALTQGVGTGINRFIDDTVAGIGAGDVMTVTKVNDAAADPFASGPAEYDPDAVSAGANAVPGSTVVALDAADLTRIAAVDGVRDAQPVLSVRADYVQHDDGTRYVATIGSVVPGQRIQLAAGSAPDDASTALETVIPVSYVEPLGFGANEDAVGQTLTIAVTDAAFARTTHAVRIVGVAKDALGGPGGTSLIPNAALTDALVAAQSVGLPAEQQDRWAQASIRFDPDATGEEIAALKDRLAGAGYKGTTVADQLGAFTTVINAIVLVLNAFAVIALLAAGLGIVNTLLMSVQERTREIGLMKAMGMGSGRIFSLFSIEAVFIGFLGSAIGVLAAIGVGSAASAALGGSLLTDLPGLTIFAVDPISIVTIVLVVMAIGFLAGTIPALRAARKDPVDALRYE